jgi:hypothetical protein
MWMQVAIGSWTPNELVYAQSFPILFIFKQQANSAVCFLCVTARNDDNCKEQS